VKTLAAAAAALFVLVFFAAVAPADDHAEAPELPGQPGDRKELT
jgi:hypothetical protein